MVNHHAAGYTPHPVAGLRHRGKREVRNADGNVVFVGRALEVSAWLDGKEGSDAKSSRS